MIADLTYTKLYMLERTLNDIVYQQYRHYMSIYNTNILCIDFICVEDIFDILTDPMVNQDQIYQSSNVRVGSSKRLFVRVE